MRERFGGALALIQICGERIVDAACRLLDSDRAPLLALYALGMCAGSIVAVALLN